MLSFRFLITLQRYIFLLYIQNNEIKIAPQLTTFYNILHLRQTGTKKAPEKHISSVLFYYSVFWLSHQKSLTLNNKEYIIFGF